MSGRIKTALACTFLILTIAGVAWYKLSQPRVLVLHSYATDYSWTRDIDIGIRRILDAKLGYKVLWHYMDAKNHPDREFKLRAGSLARHAIDALHPTVIIAIDDDAQAYAAKEYAGGSGVAIVFAGVNGSVQAYGYHGAANVTGIFERKPLRDVRRALVDMRGPGGAFGKRILLVGDLSESVQTDTNAILEFDWSPYSIARSVRTGNFAEWKKAVLESKGTADLILVTNYHNVFETGERKKLVSASEIMTWTENNSPVPVIGMSGFVVEEGGMFAVAPSGFEQGESAARMAVRIIDKDAPPDSIPTEMPRQFLVYMRQSLLAKRGISLPPLYEAFARASNNHYE